MELINLAAVTLASSKMIVNSITCGVGIGINIFLASRKTKPVRRSKGLR